VTPFAAHFRDRGPEDWSAVGFHVSPYAAGGHSTDQIAIRTKSSAQRRNLPLEMISLDDPIGPHARRQRVLGNHCSVRLDQRHQHVKGATAELDRPTVGE
jgi:hypothetical protein